MVSTNSNPPTFRERNPETLKRATNRNYGAAFFQMMTIALLSTSLAQPSWLSLINRSTSIQPSETCPKHLTLYHFFDYGYFETVNVFNGTTSTPIRMLYHSNSGTMGCLTPLVVNLFKVILMLVVLAITLSFVGFLLDILGTKSRLCLTLRTNGLLTVPIVLLCAAIVSVAYYITVLIERENRHSHFVEVEFDYGFFTLSAAGATSLLATASFLFQKSNVTDRRRSRSRHRRSHRSSRLRSSSHLMLVEDMENPSLPDNRDLPPPYSV